MHEPPNSARYLAVPCSLTTPVYPVVFLSERWSCSPSAVVALLLPLGVFFCLGVLLALLAFCFLRLLGVCAGRGSGVNRVALYCAAAAAVHVLASCLVSILILHTGHVPLFTMSDMHDVHSCTLVSVALAPQHGVRLVGPVSKHTAHSPSICGIYSVVVVSVCSV